MKALDPEKLIEHRESEPSEFFQKKDLLRMEEPEWPGETIRKQEDEKNINKFENNQQNSWRDSDS